MLLCALESLNYKNILSIFLIKDVSCKWMQKKSMSRTKNLVGILVRNDLERRIRDLHRRLSFII